MAIEKIINIKVNDSDVDELNKDLQSLDKNLNKVEGGSKKASKGLKDVGENGGAISVLDSLTGGLATRVRDAAEASKLFSFNLKGIRTALIATGIGAFVVALGLVVAYWEDIKNFITGSNVELERQLEIQQDITNEAQREVDILDKKDNILKLEGKTQEQINALKREKLQLLIQERNKELQIAKERLQSLVDIQKGGGSALESFFKASSIIIEAFARIVDGFFAKIGFDTDFGSAASGLTGSILEGIFGTEEEILEAEQRVIELENAILESQNRVAGIDLETQESNKREKEKQNPLQALTAEEQQALLDKKSQQFEELFDLQKTQEDRLLESARLAGEQLLNGEVNLNAVRTQEEKAYAEARIKIAEREAAAKRTAFLGYADALSTISGVLGTQTAEGKALAVASSLVNTYASITGQLKAFSGVPVPGYAIAQAIATGVVGFANVKKILDVKVPNVSGSRGASVGGNVSGGGSGTSAPSFNVVGNSGVSQIAQTLNQEQQPVEAYVVAGNVSSAQELNRNIVETATIG